MENTKVEELENGDIFASKSGLHVGNMDVDFLQHTEQAVHLQVFRDGKWYCYTLTDVVDHEEKKEHEPAKG